MSGGASNQNVGLLDSDGDPINNLNPLPVVSGGTFTRKQLGQLRPPNTTATSIYSPPASTTTIITSLVICNTTGSSVKARVFIDDDGTTYDQSTALIYDPDIAANTTVEFSIYWTMNDDNGNLAVRTETNDALTFTVFGVEITP